jgi:hypothetical protein
VYPVHQRRYLAIQEQAWSRIIFNLDAPNLLPKIAIVDRKNTFPADMLSIDQRPHAIR